MCRGRDRGPLPRRRNGAPDNPFHPDNFPHATSEVLMAEVHTPSADGNTPVKRKKKKARSTLGKQPKSAGGARSSQSFVRLPLPPEQPFRSP